MKVTLEFDLITTQEWATDKGFLLPIPRNMLKSTNILSIDTRILTSMQETVLNAINSDTTTDWVISGVRAVDNGVEGV